MLARCLCVFVALFALTASTLCSGADVPPTDPRFKTDLLLVVAHPDDETVIASYLARIIREDHKRVAVVFGTHGSEGGNAYGQEQGAALGLVRGMEARRALAHLGIQDVWFLNGVDTPGQDVLRSLERWHHGEALEELVRIVRLTRPAVVVSWLPIVSAGENHGDHQAAGVLATEAFGLSGNPLAFPEQVVAPRDRNGLNNELEGLHPWQPQKLYFYSDAADISFLKNKGPRYAPGKYVRIAAEETSEHQTQSDSGAMAHAALAANASSFGYLDEPVQFVLGKSLVGGDAHSDIFAGTTGAIAYVQPEGYHPKPAPPGVSIRLGGDWHFYEQFWPANGLATFASLLKPEIEINYESPLTVPVLVTNNSAADAEIHLSSQVPNGWVYWRKLPQSVHLAPGDSTEVTFETRSPDQAAASPSAEILVEAQTPGRTIEPVHLRVAVKSSGMPQ